MGRITTLIYLAQAANPARPIRTCFLMRTLISCAPPRPPPPSFLGGALNPYWDSSDFPARIFAVNGKNHSFVRGFNESLKTLRRLDVLELLHELLTEGGGGNSGVGVMVGVSARAQPHALAGGCRPPSSSAPLCLIRYLRLQPGSDDQINELRN